MIKLAVIGVGRMGTYHATVASQNSNVDVVALINRGPIPHNIQQLHPSAVQLQSHLDILDSIDAAIIATPTGSHFEIARDCLMAGKHVLIEKPLTFSYGQALELFSIAKQSRCALHVGHVERFNPAFIEAQKLITKQPLLVQTTRSGPYNDRVKSDSVTLDLMIHDIDLIMTLLNETPLSTHAIGTSHISETIDSALTTMQFASGPLATLTTHRGASTGIRRMTIETPAETLELDLAKRELTCSNQDGTQIIKAPSNYNPLAEQLKHFCTAVTTGKGYRKADHDLRVLSQALLIDEQTKATSLPYQEGLLTTSVRS